VEQSTQAFFFFKSEIMETSKIPFLIKKKIGDM